MKEVFNKIFLIKGYCNTYYVDDEVKVLIDAGSDVKKPVDLLILTHLHPDHAFFAQKIKERTDCKILISEEDNKIQLLLKYFPEWDGKKIEFFKPDKLLENGSIIRTGKYSFRVIHAPGHTLGSACLFEPVHKILFSGDVLFADGFIGRTDLPHSSPEKMKTTLEELKKIDYKILLPGHGRIVKKDL
ncbi:hypothetical protein COX58_03345 [archaeon CG_4_10_14_0_2_um_filter_Archaea_38_6]|nr:MAG: hypothetical protein COS83_04420 [archaeon CG07_land_8_20_14_0_80_38_8]PIU89254.1 MAG: hypothetical protein COS64_01560 [archaeon CG06_land_8_20_14_3_00_37_11]PJA21820.1 MAG: hypothetical protein COX58_03345 [archaeon CG_4_10_14_0_2_um_filter_Archaea_38_6]